MKAIEDVDAFALENDVASFEDHGAVDAMLCHAQVARAIMYYIGCNTKLTTSKDYSASNFSDDVCREVRLLNNFLSEERYGGMKKWVPPAMLMKLNKIVMGAK